MNLSNSYFAISNPLLVFDRCFNRFCHQGFVVLQGKRIEIVWTERAEAAFKSRRDPLLIEMQLYFSCVVKKRVIFHVHADLEAVVVSDKMKIAYRAIQSAACDPETFARDHPQGRELDSNAARKMQPSKLSIDFRRGRWLGEMGFGH